MSSINHETEFVEREHEMLILLSTPNTTDGHELEHWRPVHLSSCLRSLAHWHWCNRQSYADTRSIERLWLSVVQHWHHHQPETKTECKTEWQTHLLLLRVSTGATQQGFTSTILMAPIWKRRMMIQISPRIRVLSPSTTFSGPIKSTRIYRKMRREKKDNLRL